MIMSIVSDLIGWAMLILLVLGGISLFFEHDDPLERYHTHGTFTESNDPYS